jgi:hypothetical protein
MRPGYISAGIKIDKTRVLAKAKYITGRNCGGIPELRDRLAPGF